MSVSPQQVRTASFTVAKKGYDTGEVDAHLRRAGDALEEANAKAAAMEARARAAVAKLQELQAEAPAAPPADEAETISRTLLLAQRTADTTIADAERAAREARAAAETDAESIRADARAEAERLVSQARDDARGAFEEERRLAESEVQALRARRDFLEGDVETLEHFLVDQRDRLREAASSLVEISERVPGGLGQLRRPVLSAAGADDDAPEAVDEATAMSRPPAVDDDESEVGSDPAPTTSDADAADEADEARTDRGDRDDDGVVIVTQDEVEGTDAGSAASDDVPTGELPLVTLDHEAASPSDGQGTSEQPNTSDGTEHDDPDATQALPVTDAAGDQPVLSLGSMPATDGDDGVTDQVLEPGRPTRFSFRGGRSESSGPRRRDRR